ncbi:MAG: DUF1385 domain-containing protein [Desulfurispora sp.]|uniref:DUF1385 domain-containing protein n=1 Tax=Desulfurispora sp. TaxID=3014275 RepID=UPI0040490178
MPADFQYGGQAVIEGVMMRGRTSRAVAVRVPDGRIVLDQKPLSSVTGRYPWLKKPLVRGVVALVESLLLGLEALNFSANQALGEEEELRPWETFLTMALAFGLAVLLFVVLPTGAAHFLRQQVPGVFWQNLLEGAVRLAVFVLYILIIARLPDIKRVFQYHGAEHKVINAYEAGRPLAVEEVRPFPTFHPRCGTSFILIVLVLSIFLFAALGHQVLWWRILSRVLLLPVLAGVSYELLKLSARYAASPAAALLLVPGRWLQSLTTAEPDDSQMEVAIAALRAVLQESEDAVHAGQTG